MIHAVYIVRPGDRNEELRYSLRSIAAVGVSDVTIVGHRPAWLTGAVVLEVPQQAADRKGNIRRNLRAIADADLGRFVYFNDDFFVMRPTDFAPTHRGPFDELLARAPSSTYWRELRRAARLLAPGALCYDALHTPLPMTSAALAYALDTFDGAHGLRSIAANFLELGGKRAPNAKNPLARSWGERVYLSTSDTSFRSAGIGKFIRARFPEPSPWEEVK